MHLVSLAFLLPCSSVLVIVSVERKKQRSIGNPIKNNWPDSQSHLLSAGILLMLSQLPTTQFPPVMPERQATGTAIWQSAVRESLVSITDGEPRLSWRLKWLTDACRDEIFYSLNILLKYMYFYFIKYFNKCWNIYFNKSKVLPMSKYVGGLNVHNILNV